MKENDGFFIGWSADTPKADRRFLLGASLALLAGAGLAGGALALRRPGGQPGRWDQSDVRRYSGLLIETPYPTLLSQDDAGVVRSMLLVGYGKDALPRLGGEPAAIELEASAIARGAHAMLAVEDPDAFARAPRLPAPFAPPLEQDLGPAYLLGEILDAKCWFGAMNPGVGLTHKACASLCAQGKLPLAFCEIGACAADEEVRLFLDERGEPHGAEVIPLVADPVFAEGRLMRRNGFIEFRVARDAIRRA